MRGGDSPGFPGIAIGLLPSDNTGHEQNTGKPVPLSRSCIGCNGFAAKGKGNAPLWTAHHRNRFDFWGGDGFGVDRLPADLFLDDASFRLGRAHYVCQSVDLRLRLHASTEQGCLLDGGVHVRRNGLDSRNTTFLRGNGVGGSATLQRPFALCLVVVCSPIRVDVRVCFVAIDPTNRVHGSSQSE